jgi:hypothetical protein
MMLEESANIIMNQEHLRTLRANDYPNMKKQEKEKYHHSIFKIAYPKNEKSQTPEEFFMKLRSKLGG